MSEMLARNLFAMDYYNEDAEKIVVAEYQLIRAQNLALLPPLAEEDNEDLELVAQHVILNDCCVGCAAYINMFVFGSKFCGPNCPGLGMTRRIKTLSINMGLSYLFPMSSLVKQARMTSTGLQIIMMFLYDHHFGVDHLRTMWPKIETEFVYRIRC
jgi:hypothetical protein